MPAHPETGYNSSEYEHNNLIKRTYALEEKMSVHEEQIKVANHRIEDLERKGE